MERNAYGTRCANKARPAGSIGCVVCGNSMLFKHDDRHQLECVCERRTGWCNSLAEAVKTWCELGETLLPANADSNVHYILRATRCSGSLEQAHYKYKDDCANRGGDD
jgi:hypothetical protein